MRLIMTLLVRNEADIVRQMLTFHLSCGVDHVIITDNDSTDGTVDILRDFVRAGVADLWFEPAQDKRQYAAVTRMALFAREQRGADWILNSDADEFWHHPSGSIKAAIPAGEARVVHLSRRNMLPPEEATEVGNPLAAMRTAVLKPTSDIYAPNLLRPLGTKALCAAPGLLRVAQGNHSADFDGPAPARWDAKVVGYHYPVRSRAQFRRKVEMAGAAYASNSEFPPEIGRHLRAWYAQLCAGELDAEYDRLVVPKAARAALMAEGVIGHDDTMHAALLALGQPVAAQHA